MTELHTFATANAIASSTLDAAHRRDHAHAADAANTAGTATGCHPHTVEVVHLGGQAAMVCHDCCTDSGFIPYREAWQQACAHRVATADVPGPATAA